MKPQVAARRDRIPRASRLLGATGILLVHWRDANATRRLAATFLLAVLALVCSAGSARAEDLYQTVTVLRREYAAELDELAAWCDERKLDAQARTTRAWLRPRDPNCVCVAVFPRRIGPPELPPDTPADAVEWRDRFLRLRGDQADAMFEIARRAIRTNRASLAFDLIVTALHEDPDHKRIRQILGYQPYRGEWRSAYEVNKLRRGQVWHEQFGWLPRNHVRRYEEGERFHRGRWISAEEDARAHRHINYGWDLETEHYTVRTNHSIEAGVELGRQLERLYQVWKQLFVRYYATEEQVAALFAGSARRPRFQLPRHGVVYFRDRDDYVQSLKPAFPGIEISIGVYADGTRRAYFFAGEDYEQRTLHHEATHQLFHESRRVAPAVGKDGNFWIVEGIALYMESLREEDGYYVLGGFDDDRMQAARYRLLVDDFYVPFAELVAYGMDDVRSDKRIATLYSQAAGLTNFLIHYDGGRYRDALVDYLTAVYSGTDTLGTLAQLTGASYEELDKQYRQFMEHGPQQPEGE